MAEKKADILESLKEQLRKKQADISVFKDLLDDYMTLYDVKKKLKTDIKKRGVTFETTSASGKATESGRMMWTFVQITKIRH